MIQKHFCTTTYIFNHDGSKCLLIRHKKLPYYFPPGGHIEANEDYFESSQREVLEELGVRAEALDYPTGLHSLRSGCLQPWEIQKYTIIDNEHYHYDLIFAATLDENTQLHPGQGESQNTHWFEVSEVDDIDTTIECKSNIKRLSQHIATSAKKLELDKRLYIWPRYDQSLKDDLATFIDGADFESWNLGDLYDKVPCDYSRDLDSKFGVFTSTGTAALHAILIALGLKPGDEVIVPSMTFIRATSPLNHLGIVPVIADVDSATGNITLEGIKEVISNKTRAVIVVHMWGVPADIKAIATFCKSNDILLIEDFSHAVFSKYNGQSVGSFGDAGFASLQRKKLVSVGEGGLIITSNKRLYETLLEVTSPGSFTKPSPDKELDFSGFGLNLRMNPFAAVTAKNLRSQNSNSINDRRVAVDTLVSILKEHPEKFELVSIPSYASDISWYSYKLKLLNIQLDELKNRKLWKFSTFGYPAIADHQYWDKSADYYPFCLGIKPVSTRPLPGHEAYLDSRVTLNIPTVKASYWTAERIQEWKDDLGL
jgi:perosamine synthetase